MTEQLAMKTTVIDGVTKYTMAFPITDEQGQAILDRNGKARFTNIIGDTPEEVAVKIAQANIEVTRALNRANQHIDTLKNKKPTPLRPAPNLAGTPLTSEEQVQVGLDLQDPRKAAAAVEKVVQSRVTPVAQEVSRQATTLNIDERRRIAREFIAAHTHDYYSNDANGMMLNQYLKEHGYEYTLDSLEVAFAALQGHLAQKPAAPAAPGNEPPAEPSNAAPGNEPPNPGNPSPQQRRAPVGGLTNSQASSRPASELTLTKEQALHMLYKEPQKYELWMRDPVKNKILNRALAGR
jgi:hypothetical protein